LTKTFFILSFQFSSKKETWGFATKLFTALIYSVPLQASTFVTVSHFYPSLMIKGKVRRLPSELEAQPWCKYQHRMEVTVNDKHTSFLPHVSNYCGKKLYITGPWWPKNMKLFGL